MLTDAALVQSSGSPSIAHPSNPCKPLTPPPTMRPPFAMTHAARTAATFFKSALGYTGEPGEPGHASFRDGTRMRKKPVPSSNVTKNILVVNTQRSQRPPIRECTNGPPATNRVPAPLSTNCSSACMAAETGAEELTSVQARSLVISDSLLSPWRAHFGASPDSWRAHFGASPDSWRAHFGASPDSWRTHFGASPDSWRTHFGASPDSWRTHFGASPDNLSTSGMVYMFLYD